MADVQLVVDDTSPEIVYSPFGDTFSTPDLLAGWNPYYSSSGFATVQGQVGNGSTSHITSLNGATLSLQWHGTNVQLLGNSSQATYTITIDGTPQPNYLASDNLLASFSDLPDEDHTLSLTFHSLTTFNQSFIAFDKAVITLPQPNTTTSGPSSFQPISESHISFTGLWGIGSQSQGNSTFSFHQSFTQGDTAMTAFQGSAFKLSGITSPSAATYSVVLKPQNPNTSSLSISRTFSARSSFQQDSLLFFASGLNESEVYSVEVFNVDGGMLGLDVNGFTVLGYRIPPTNPPGIPTPFGSSRASSYPPGTMAALALSGILLFVFISMVLFYVIYWRPRARQKSLERRTTKPRDRESGESGEIVIIQREKYVTDDNDNVVRDIFTPSPRDGMPRAKSDDVQDGSSFRFSFKAKGKGKPDPEKTNTTRSLDSKDASSDKPRLSSNITTNITPTTPLTTTRQTVHRSQDIYNNRSSGLQDVGPSQAHDRPTTVESQVTTQALSTSADSLTCDECRADETDPNTEPLRVEPVIEAGDGQRSRRGTFRSSSKYSDDQGLEYVDLEYVLTNEGDGALGNSRKSNEIDEGSEFQAALQTVSPDRNRDNDAERLLGREASESPTFLKVRETSPFRVDFSHHSSKNPRASSSKARHSGSRVRFQDPSASSKDDSDNAGSPPPPVPTSILQSAPHTAPPHQRNTTSFLDLTGSPSGSLRTYSSSNSSRRNQPPERSRWSSTTTSQSAYTNPSNVTGPQGYDEFRWSLPTSPRMFPFRFSFLPPHIQRRSAHQNEPRLQQLPEVQTLTISPPSSPLNVHPFTVADAATIPSPTHSVPTTISDLHFRHSMSDDVSRAESRPGSTGSHLPPHPPLPSGFPGSRQQQREERSLSRVSSSQPNIVQRVLGLQSPGPQTPSTIGRGSGSGSSSIMSPPAGRRFRP